MATAAILICPSFFSFLFSSPSFPLFRFAAILPPTASRRVCRSRFSPYLHHVPRYLAGKGSVGTRSPTALRRLLSATSPTPPTDVSEDFLHHIFCFCQSPF
ncbi:hypothetical protein HDK64DRAFT_273220 [Phyllosticta capitalensis]